MEEGPKFDNYYELFKSVLANGCSISFESAWGDGPSFSWSGKMPELCFHVGDEECYLSGNYLLEYFESTLKFMNKLSLYSDVQEIYFYGDGYKVIGIVDADISTTLKSWKYTRP